MAWWNPRTWGRGSQGPALEHRVISTLPGIALDLNGGFAAPYSCSYRGALSIPGVHRAATLIADTIASLPQKAYRNRAGNPTEEVSYLILERPTYPLTRVEAWSGMILDLILNGNALALIASRDSSGTPNGLLPIPASQVGIRRTETGAVEYSYLGNTYTQNEVFHVRGPHEPGDVRGLGALELHFRTLDLAQGLTDQAQDIGKGVPSGLLKVLNPDATEADLRGVKSAWLAGQATRTIGVLNATTEFMPLAWNPTEAQLLETRKFSLTELALIFGIPPYFLNAENASGTYTNVQQEALNLVKYSLQGHIARIEQALSDLLPNGTKVELTLDALLRADTLTRFQAYSVALASQFMTVNEVRALENLAPVPWGDEPIRNATPAPPTQNQDPGDEVNNVD
ncbi:phage portal protein [Amycolatopsis sp. NPDC051903]|uniref:phage portal protein n=1 Tax=Amycolatopsis sp. NPDC051903 TaxID=3363936 RepID=UPI0037B6D5E8